jgi:hypothetical protein
MEVIVKCFKLPIFGDKLVCIKTLRKSCEHSCFCGALIDFLGYLAHTEMVYIVLAGKLAFVLGALGVYLIHSEETLQGLPLS